MGGAQTQQTRRTRRGSISAAAHQVHLILQRTVQEFAHPVQGAAEEMVASSDTSSSGLWVGLRTIVFDCVEICVYVDVFNLSLYV